MNSSMHSQPSVRCTARRSAQAYLQSIPSLPPIVLAATGCRRTCFGCEYRRPKSTSSDRRSESTGIQQPDINLHQHNSAAPASVYLGTSRCQIQPEATTSITCARVGGARVVLRCYEPTAAEKPKVPCAVGARLSSGPVPRGRRDLVPELGLQERRGERGGHEGVLPGGRTCVIAGQQGKRLWRSHGPPYVSLAGSEENLAWFCRSHRHPA